MDVITFSVVTLFFIGQKYMCWHIYIDLLSKPSMQKYRYLPHTADMRFRSYGRDFGEALENAAAALLNIMLDVKRIEKDGSGSRTITIKETADSESEMAWFVLQDILSKIDSMKLNAYKFKVTSVKRANKISMTGKLTCKKTKADYAMLSVKAVTPHDLNVKKAKAGVSINIVVDV